MRPRRPLLFRRPAAAGSAAVALAALALLAAGCGGSAASKGVAAVGTTTTAQTAKGSPVAVQTVFARAVRYSACMRSHGVAQFPDPTREPGGVKLVIGPGSGVDPRSASFQEAAKACRSLLPAPRGQSGGQIDAQQLAGALSFSRCMRRHGVQGFPDPSSQQGLTLRMVQAAGVNVSSRRVQAAAMACVPAAHGAITAAQIRQAEVEAAHGSGGGG